MGTVSKKQKGSIDYDNTMMPRKKTTITLALNDNFLDAIKKEAENKEKVSMQN